jgi:hypothetical protein
MSDVPQQVPEYAVDALNAMERAVRRALTVAPCQVRERLDALQPEIFEAERPLRRALLRGLLDELETEFGPVLPEQFEQAAREWPDYEG